MKTIKIVNDDQKTVEITVLNEKSVNYNAILNVDEQLNSISKIDLVNSVLNEIETEKLISTFKTNVEQMSKRNDLISVEYELIKEDIFKKIEKMSFDDINDLINEKLMLLEITGQTKKVYNCFDFWYTHNDQKLKKFISGYNTLKTYQKLFNSQKEDK